MVQRMFFLDDCLMVMSYFIIAGYVLVPVLIVLLFSRFEQTRRVGTVVMAYAAGILMALSGLLPAGQEAGAQVLAQGQKVIMSIAVPVAIPLMLFGSDFRLWAKSLPKTMTVLLGGMASVVVAVAAGYLLFRNSQIPQFEKIAAMMTGIYTGGTMNFNSLGMALQVDPGLMVVTLTFEEMVTFPFILFIVAGGYKLFRKLLPCKNGSANVEGGAEAVPRDGFENYRGMLSRRVFPKMLLALALASAMVVASAGVSILIAGKVNELIVILLVTTLAVLASFSKKVRDLPKTFELGMFFILIFSVVVASQFSISAINRSTVMILWYILFVMLVSIVLHVAICRLFKVDGDLFTAGHVGLLCSPPFVPPVAEAMGNKSVLLSGIVIGLVGYAAGNYLGIAVAALTGAL